MPFVACRLSLSLLVQNAQEKSLYLFLMVSSPSVQAHVLYPRLLFTDFATESVEDEDEVLTALSEELGGFVEYVGGPDHAHVLLSPLENLAAIEELLVRDKVRCILIASSMSCWLTCARLSNHLTKSASNYRKTRSSNTLFPSSAAFPKQTGSQQRSPLLASTKSHTQSPPLPRRRACARPLPSSYTMTPQWSEDRLPSTSPSSSASCLLRLSLKK